MHPSSLFALDDVHVTRAAREVLAGASCEIAPGASAIVGPSGAEKSTLLRLLNRLADPHRETILLRGRDIRTLDVLALRRDVALVPQLPALLPGTVEDNTGLALGNQSTADEQRTQRLLSAARFRLSSPRSDRGGVRARLSARVAETAEAVSVAWSRGGEAERRALGVPAHRPRPTRMHHTAA